MPFVLLAVLGSTIAVSAVLVMYLLGRLATARTSENSCIVPPRFPKPSSLAVPYLSGEGAVLLECAAWH